MKREDSYIKALKINKEKTKEYYQKFLLQKSEQQKFLEKILKKQKLQPDVIADIACGSGTLTYHISKKYPESKFILVDLNEEALKLAKENLKISNVEYLCESIYNLSSIESESCDLVFCWQTLSWIDYPENALCELIRICKKGGKIYASSLFNINHDVDIYAKVLDRTSNSIKEKVLVNYNTYSIPTVKDWIGHLVSEFEIYPFNIGINIPFNGRGLGTYTVKINNSKRLQISGGILMNWGILVITK